ncbi:MAG: anti-sigma factor [Streptosporangiaceae bacterium]
MRLLRESQQVLTGVYAVGAMTSLAEREKFERHLRRCASCASEVRGLRDTATILALAAAEQPPPELRARTLAQVRQTRQLPPQVEPRRGGSTGRWTPRLRLAVPVAVAVASLLAVLVLAVAQARVQRALHQARAQNAAIAAVLATPGARIVTGPTSAGGTTTAVVAAATHEVVVTTAGLPGLPAGRVYEMWLIGRTGTRPIGLVRARPSGHTAPILATGLARGDRLGITVEPARGTRHPTTAPIVVLPLT